MLAVFQLGDGVQPASADVFIMENGEVIAGNVIDATRHAVVVHRDIGGLQQARYHDIREIRVTDQDGNLIVGKLGDWSDGLYTIEVDGRPVKLRHGVILETAKERPETRLEPSESTRTPNPQARDLAATSPKGSLASEKPNRAARDETGLDRSNPSRLEIITRPTNENEPFSQVRLLLDRPLDHSLAVIYTTLDGSAKAGLDYEAERGVISMRPGQMSLEMRLSLIDDELEEEEETFTLYLAIDPKQAKLESKRIPMTIRDNE